MPNDARQILIVDDEQDIRSLLKVSLEKKGYLCHTADGAEAAMEVLIKEPVDLALIDIIMPGMTGLSLFKHIKETFPGVAIVFVTNVDDMNLAFDSIIDGAYDYIIKSKIPFKLFQSVERALGLRDAAIQRDRHMDHLEELVEHQSSALRQKFQEITALNRMFRDKLTVEPEESS